MYLAHRQQVLVTMMKTCPISLGRGQVAPKGQDRVNGEGINRQNQRVDGRMKSMIDFLKVYRSEFILVMWTKVRWTVAIAIACALFCVTFEPRSTPSSPYSGLIR